MKKTIFAMFMAGLMLATVFSACFSASAAFVGEKAEPVDFEDGDVIQTGSANGGDSDYSKRYVVIVVGVYQTSQHYTFFLKAAQNMYDTLLSERYGFEKDNIFVLLNISDDWAEPDIFDPDIVDYSATESNILTVLNQFKNGEEKEIPSDGLLFFTWIGHGATNSFGLESGTVTSDELKSYVSGINGRLIFVLQPCMSGSFIDELSRDNRIICTSVGSYGMEGGWIEAFTRGLNGEADTEPGVGNNDRKVSVEEAFHLAAEHVVDELKFSRLDDNGDGEGHGPYSKKWGYDIDDPTKDGYRAARVYDLRYEEMNLPPNKPSINGPKEGDPQVEYEYTFAAKDPDGDQVYYYTDWGDGDTEEWIGPYDSGEVVTVSHIWDEQGTYEIKAKAKDVHGAESDWATLSVSMPKNTDSNDDSGVQDDIAPIIQDPIISQDETIDQKNGETIIEEADTSNLKTDSTGLADSVTSGTTSTDILLLSLPANKL